jgi:hypothetical protein
MPNRVIGGMQGFYILRCSMFLSKKFGSAAVLIVGIVGSALIAATPSVAQVSLYHMDFKPADFNAASPGLQAGEANIGPTNFAMPGFGWDESHGQSGRPGVFYPNNGLNPEDPTNRAFLFLFGSNGQTNSTFTSTTTPGSTFPAAGIDPTAPANTGLGISWSQHLENTANGGSPAAPVPVHVQVAVQTAGGNWYLSSAVYDTSVTGAGSQGNFDPQLLTYSSAKANWLNLTIPPGGTVAAPTFVQIGSQPASNLTGNITGVGFVASFISTGSSTVHIDFVDVGIPPVPGDVTGDRLVTMADYNIIKSNFGTNQIGRAQGDLTGDGVVNLLDFAQWKTAFSGGGSLGAGTVPEPTSFVLMGLGLSLGCSMLRLRKSNSNRCVG